MSYLKKISQKYLYLKGQKVFIALSGGVDSAVVALILKTAEVDCQGVFMKNWAGEKGLQLECPWKEDQEMAQKICEILNIPFFSYNFEKQYKQEVFDYFIQEYKAGRTPNPDILCNSKIKFHAFLNKAQNQGAQMIATGHYAGINENGDLIKARDQNKDQTYFLSGLNVNQLNSSVFPLSDLTKQEVRKIAKKNNLPNAEKKDSQGICFIGDLDVQKFLKKYIKKQIGDIIDIDTKKKIGEHEGIFFYTIGQRQGIGVGGSKKPYYVVKKNHDTNTLFVGKGRDHRLLNVNVVGFQNLHLINNNYWNLYLSKNNIKACIRYRGKLCRGELIINSQKEDIFQKSFVKNNMHKVSGKFVFANPQWAPASGQSIVFYFDDICLGKAIIV